MTTRFIGMKEFRQNMAKISEDAYKKNQRLVILRKNRAIFEIRPLSKEQAFEDEILLRVEEAKEDHKAGRTYSQTDVEKLLGL